MEWIVNLENGLSHIVVFVQFILESLFLLCVVIGLLQTLKFILKIQRRRYERFPFIEIRLKFGLWLSMALELQLGADILGTTIAPNLEFLGRLATLVVIRTFLNYFLSKDLAEEIELKEKNYRI